MTDKDFVDENAIDPKDLLEVPQEEADAEPFDDPVHSEEGE